MAVITAARWSSLRLNVHRGIGDRSYVTLVLRQGNGREEWHRRLHSVEIPTPPGSAASRSPVLALVEAVVALAVATGETSHLLETRAQPPAPLEGPQGVEGQLRLDLPGYNR